MATLSLTVYSLIYFHRRTQCALSPTRLPGCGSPDALLSLYQSVNFSRAVLRLEMRQNLLSQQPHRFEPWLGIISIVECEQEQCAEAAECLVHLAQFPDDGLDGSYQPSM